MLLHYNILQEMQSRAIDAGLRELKLSNERRTNSNLPGPRRTRMWKASYMVLRSHD